MLKEQGSLKCGMFFLVPLEQMCAIEKGSGPVQLLTGVDRKSVAV